MRLETYLHIKEHIHLLNIDYENGIILNRAQHYCGKYLKIKFKQKMVSVHNIIVFIKYGKQCINLTVNHEDGDKGNNKPSNLTLMTLSENIQHAFDVLGKKVNVAKGMDTHNSILTDDDVREIRRLLSQGLMKKTIAEMYNIDPSTISRINSGTRWAHVK